MSIQFAVIQSGYAVFGVGETRQAAIADAAQWMEPDDGATGPRSPAEVEALLVTRPAHGQFCLIDRAHPDFDSYLETQGGFVYRDGEWFEE